MRKFWHSGEPWQEGGGSSRCPGLSHDSIPSSANVRWVSIISCLQTAHLKFSTRGRLYESLEVLEKGRSFLKWRSLVCRCQEVTAGRATSTGHCVETQSPSSPGLQLSGLLIEGLVHQCLLRPCPVSPETSLLTGSILSL